MEVTAMATRGDRVLVQGYKGREAILRVWETKVGGLLLSSEDGYRRLVEGDQTAPLVGFPARDVQRTLDAEPLAPSHPSLRPGSR